LGKEEKASTLASIIVFLTLVCFKNLISIVFRVKRLDDLIISDSINKPDIFEYLLSVGFHLDVDLYSLKVFFG
jgi:hypothetical protein